MSSRYLWRLLTRRRGTSPAGVSLALGYGRRSASTGTRPSTGTRHATRSTVEGCSFIEVLGPGQVVKVTPPPHLQGNSYIERTFFGRGTDTRGVSGQPPECAD